MRGAASGGGSTVAKATNPQDGRTPTRPRMVLAKTRAQEAIELRMQGLTFEAIAGQIGVTREAARKAVLRALEETNQAIAERADELRSIEAQRLERITEVLWPRVLEGDLKAIDRVIRTRESFRRLTGLDLHKDAGDGATGDTYIVQAGGDISLVPPGGVAIDTRPPWSRPELRAGDVIDAEAVEEGEE